MVVNVLCNGCLARRALRPQFTPYLSPVALHQPTMLHPWARMCRRVPPPPPPPPALCVCLLIAGGLCTWHLPYLGVGWVLALSGLLGLGWGLPGPSFAVVPAHPSHPRPLTHVFMGNDGYLYLGGAIPGCRLRGLQPVTPTGDPPPALCVCSLRWGVRRQLCRAWAREGFLALSWPSLPSARGAAGMR